MLKWQFFQKIIKIVQRMEAPLLESACERRRQVLDVSLSPPIAKLRLTPAVML